MEKAVGHEVTIVRINPAPARKRAKRRAVLATNGGVVLKIGDRIEVLRDDGLPARVIFDKVPDNLRARPTLSVTVNGAHSGPGAGHLELSHPGARLASGLCRALRRGDREDRRAGLGHADQLERHDLRQRARLCWSPARPT